MTAFFRGKKEALNELYQRVALQKGRETLLQVKK